MQAAGVAVTPDDLLSIVDAVYLGEGGQWDVDDAAKLGATGPRGNIQRGEDFAAQQKAVAAPGVAVASDNLAVIVDASCNGATGGRGIVEGDEAAAAQQETVLVVTRIEKRSDDHARVVDAKCPGEAGGQGIIDRGEDVDRHVVALLVDVRSSSGHRVATAGSQPCARPGRLTKDAARVKKLIAAGRSY